MMCLFFYIVVCVAYIDLSSHSNVSLGTIPSKTINTKDMFGEVMAPQVQHDGAPWVDEVCTIVLYHGDLVFGTSTSILFVSLITGIANGGGESAPQSQNR